MNADELSALQRRIDLFTNMAFDLAYFRSHPLSIWKGDTMPTPETTTQEPSTIQGGPKLSGGAETATQAIRRALQEINQRPWGALTTDQQVERMREVVKQLEHTVNWHSRRFQELSEKLSALEEHDHVGGRVVIPVISKSRGQAYGAEACEARVPGWF